MTLNAIGKSRALRYLEKIVQTPETEAERELSRLVKEKVGAGIRQFRTKFEDRSGVRFKTSDDVTPDSVATYLAEVLEKMPTPAPKNSSAHSSLSTPASSNKVADPTHSQKNENGGSFESSTASPAPGSAASVSDFQPTEGEKMDLTSSTVSSDSAISPTVDPSSGDQQINVTSSTDISVNSSPVPVTPSSASSVSAVPSVSSPRSFIHSFPAAGSMADHPVELDFAMVDTGVTPNTIRGVITSETLQHVQWPPYQRERVGKKVEKMVTALQEGAQFPDIVCATERHTYDTRNGIIRVLDSMNVVDGFQRLSATKEFMANGGPGARLGVSVRLDMDLAQQTELFRILNALRSPVSANILLRNQTFSNPGMKALHELCSDDSFVMKNRICWKQNPGKGDLIPASGFIRDICWQHEKIHPAHTKELDQVGETVQGLYKKLGPEKLAGNVRTFYAFIEQTWGLSKIKDDDEKPPYLLAGFQASLARFFSAPRFWKDGVFNVDSKIVERLKTFPFNDQLVRIASGAGSKPHPDLVAKIKAESGLLY